VNRDQRNALVVENLPLVGYLVRDLCARATHLSRDDLAAAGALALVTSADAYDPTLGVPFGAFARRRIIGSFADTMRTDDWATRSARRRIRETLAVQETLTASLGRAPSVDEIASTLGVDRQTATDALTDASRTVSTLDEVNTDLLIADNSTPEETVITQERTVFVRSSVAALPDDMRYIIEQIYFEERTVKEIAEELGFTHSAVSQKRSEAVRLIRDGLTTHYSEDERAAQAAAESRIAPVRRAAYLARVAEYAKAGMVDGLMDAGWEQSAVS